MTEDSPDGSGCKQRQETRLGRGFRTAESVEGGLGIGKRVLEEKGLGSQSGEVRRIHSTSSGLVGGVLQ